MSKRKFQVGDIVRVRNTPSVWDYAPRAVSHICVVECWNADARRYTVALRRLGRPEVGTFYARELELVKKGKKDA